MCTVTYIPTLKNQFVFTSNRDESPKRATLKPTYYKEDGVDLFYPKDEVANGTWIGLSEKKRLVCLLNGGFEYHNPLLKFPKSRGIVVKDVLKTDSLLQTLEGMVLEGVAPFTLLVLDWGEDLTLTELVWCKEKKHVNILDAEKPQIWSSSTLYTQETKTDRKDLFDSYLNELEVLTQDQVLKFHQNEQLGCVETALKMKRSMVETISTTSVLKSNEEVSMIYKDYVQGSTQAYEHLFEEVVVKR